MDWARDGADWPLRAHSRFVSAGGLRWHVQQYGAGSVALLLHGTGAATHSWRDFGPALAQRYTIVAPDLPGHAFTSAAPPYRMSLPGMAEALAQLLRAIDLAPELVVGHSAGAAIAARMALDGAVAPRRIVALNGAMLPIPGMPGQLFSGIAKTLAMVPLVPSFFAWRAGDPAAVDRLLASTGSRIDARGRALYARLLRDSGHVGNVLGMMANWDLDAFARDLPRLAVPLLLIAAEGDRAVPPSVSLRVRRAVAGAELLSQPGLGHLSHEEQPEATAALIP